MSNDHIFAAQMWSWADPMIKRDSHGRILVVNAAFLQLYGGTVESWTGNPIQGWPNPKNPGEISRFESRIPQDTGGEIVYDWMECTLADGSALAMARDVSVYAAVQPTPIVAPSMAPTQEAQSPVMEQPVVAQTAEPTVNPAQMQNDVQNDIGSLSPLAQLNQPAAQPEPIVQAAPEPAPTPAPAQQAVLAAHAPVEAQPAPVAAAQPVASAPAPAPAPVTPPTAPAPTQAAPMAQAAPEPENRDFERRALPIEDGDAILGNNWRDAVIAKAVGVEEGHVEEPVEEDATAKTASGEQIRVLLAEDNAINALLTRTLLEAEGCICDVVEDGALAVEAVRNNEYHMIFMDMRMPNMDGLEATRKIRSMGYGPKVLPIVALTANAFDDDRNACFDSGMNDFMTKPVSAEELSAMVQTHTALEAEKLAS